MSANHDRDLSIAYGGSDGAVHRVVDAFVDALDLTELGFAGVAPEATGRPGYHPATLLKIYLYGYLNQVQSSRRLERECGRNLELIWLTGRLAPDFKTIADFRRNNGPARRLSRGKRPEVGADFGLCDETGKGWVFGNHATAHKKETLADLAQDIELERRRRM
jgi:transposase-like protein DUF772